MTLIVSPLCDFVVIHIQQLGIIVNVVAVFVYFDGVAVVVGHCNGIVELISNSQILGRSFVLVALCLTYIL